MEYIWRQMHGDAMRNAAELLAWRGYEKVQAWELARAAHVSVGTMYRQYGNKRNFALEVRRFTEEELCRFTEWEYWKAQSKHEEDYRACFLAFWNTLAWGCARNRGCSASPSCTGTRRTCATRHVETRCETWSARCSPRASRREC